jgi:hypothetical protein
LILSHRNIAGIIKVVKAIQNRLAATSLKPSMINLAFKEHQVEETSIGVKLFSFLGIALKKQLYIIVTKLLST